MREVPGGAHDDVVSGVPRRVSVRAHLDVAIAHPRRQRAPGPACPSPLRRHRARQHLVDVAPGLGRAAASARRTDRPRGPRPPPRVARRTAGGRSSPGSARGRRGRRRRTCAAIGGSRGSGAGSRGRGRPGRAARPARTGPRGARPRHTRRTSRRSTAPPRPAHPDEPGRQVAHEHVRDGAQERERAAALDPRAPAAHPLAGTLAHLDRELAGHQRQLAREEPGLEHRPPELGAADLARERAHRERAPRCAAGHEVPDARAVMCEQPGPAVSGCSGHLARSGHPLRAGRSPRHRPGDSRPSAVRGPSRTSGTTGCRSRRRRGSRPGSTRSAPALRGATRRGGGCAARSARAASASDHAAGRAGVPRGTRRRAG